MKSQIHVIDGIEPTFPPYPMAVRAGGFVFLSGVRKPGAAPGGFAAIPESGRVRMQGFAAADLVEGKVTSDAWQAHEQLAAILEASGSGNDLILRQHIWQRDKAYFPAYEQVRMVTQPKPAPSSGLGVTSVAGNPEDWVGLDCIAACPDDRPDLGEVAITVPAKGAGRPSTAHYSQSLSYGPLLFLAGHIPIDTRAPDKPLVTRYDQLDPEHRFLQTNRSHTDTRQGPIAAQASFAYVEIKRHLEELGHTMADVVHVTVFLQRTSDYPTFHRVHRHFFPDQGPSLTISVFDEVGHKGSLIEIEPTIVRRDTWPRAATQWDGPPPVAAPAASAAGDLVFFSGMIGLDESGRLVRSADDLPSDAAKLVRPLQEVERSPGAAAQCWMAWRRLAAAMSAASVSLSGLAKVTLYVADAADLAVHEAVRKQFVASDLPAFECVCVPGPGGVPGAAMQIEAIGLR